VPRYVRAADAAVRQETVTVSRLTHDDLGRLVILDARCFDEPWSTAMFAEELARPAAEVVQLGARLGNRLVGAVLAARIGDCWHVMTVMVDPALRRRGIARDLVQRMLDTSAHMPLGVGDGWTLEVRASGVQAQALYTSLGFAPIGRRRGYYAGTGEDAVVMWRSADDGGI
jgi:ribosomal-protein-alanine N-acetyltransferase